MDSGGDQRKRNTQEGKKIMIERRDKGKHKLLIPCRNSGRYEKYFFWYVRNICIFIVCFKYKEIVLFIL